MSRENSFQGIILKKVSFGESDEIVTFFSESEGKIRALSKASKYTTSRLATYVQPLVYSELRLTKSTSLPKVIGGKVVHSFVNLRQNIGLVKEVFVAIEIVIKATPDEQKNQQLFKVLFDYLMFLDSLDSAVTSHIPALLKFKILALEALGLGIAWSEEQGFEGLAFSNTNGGFVAGGETSRALPADLVRLFTELKNTEFQKLHLYYEYLDKLDKIVSGFFIFQLEREIKAEKFLGNL
jgi:DNA repair protein RecO